MPEVLFRSTENGPNLVIVDRKVVKAYCRCGGSSNKPFWDGTRAKNSFRASPHEVKVL